MKKNFKIVIEYDGTDFVGWQRQANGRSVQETIENALEKIVQQNVGIVGAGRTDSGVHARGQVANFSIDTSISPKELSRALNGVLPDDVAIRSVNEADLDFSARYSATAREYGYYISRVPTAINRRYSWSLGYQLDVPAMNSLCGEFIGKHDFQSFCKADSSADNYLCTVMDASWSEREGSLLFTIRANRFLHGMVRALVGTMVDIGRGHRSPGNFSEILSSKKRTKAGQSAPPHGLFLERVIY
jgi:tRNA pseudouridine38-40 synthase